MRIPLMLGALVVAVGGSTGSALAQGAKEGPDRRADTSPAPGARETVGPAHARMGPVLMGVPCCRSEESDE